MMNTIKSMRPIASRFKASTGALPTISRSYSACNTQPTKGSQCSLNPSHNRAQLRPSRFRPIPRHLLHPPHWLRKVLRSGADIKEMSTLTFSEAYTTSFIESWSSLTTSVKKPIIAAVSGHALGGGCELALMCDILYCTENANFGQPEIKLGTIPGAGGSQRLTRAIGKVRAMELILTGKSFTGKEAGEWGVAARTFAGWDELMEGSLRTAEIIASYSKVAVMAAKEVVNKSQDLPLRDGVEYERRVFHSLFGSEDQKVGMSAFAEKKKPLWKHQ
ncbi:hypothetical protein G7Y89_g8103 [Cudoniella acicularis]|uniref:Enoyl-CoA hydratase n=1 Tax=Cudoniella acicularis TaxID=354080 RepID=A0A8H4RH93_9HELO|nr:hypothetical protein G7Y89_g8103 [Cudoniella acicularis]